jgi:hypothetical protein
MLAFWTYRRRERGEERLSICGHDGRQEHSFGDFGRSESLHYKGDATSSHTVAQQDDLQAQNFLHPADEVLHQILSRSIHTYQQLISSVTYITTTTSLPACLQVV